MSTFLFRLESWREFRNLETKTRNLLLLKVIMIMRNWVMMTRLLIPTMMKRKMSLVIMTKKIICSTHSSCHSHLRFFIVYWFTPFINSTTLRIYSPCHIFFPLAFRFLLLYLHSFISLQYIKNSLFLNYCSASLQSPRDAHSFIIRRVMRPLVQCLKLPESRFCKLKIMKNKADFISYVLTI